MNDIALPDYDEIDAQVVRLQLGQDPSELHGALCGYLSGGSSAPGREAWLGTVMADDTPAAIEADSPLDRMYLASEKLIESPDLARMAASDLAYDDPESDEQALEEVAEFVRVAALLLHSDCVLAPRHRRSLN